MKNGQWGFHTSQDPSPWWQVDLGTVGNTDAANRSEILVPLLKAWGTDIGVEVAGIGVQVHGGMGFVEETGAAQHWRDARIAPIYEGTNGVQAMDLCGRKLASKGGRAIQAFFKMIDEEIAEAKGNEALADIATKLEKALGEQKAATMWFMQNAMANPNHLGAGAHHYMHIMGIVTLGFFWLKQAKTASAALAGNPEDKAFYEAKMTSAAYYTERFLPDAGALRRKLEAGSENMMALPEEAFSTAA